MTVKENIQLRNAKRMGEKICQSSFLRWKADGMGWLVTYLNRTEEVETKRTPGRNKLFVMLSPERIRN